MPLVLLLLALVLTMPVALTAPRLDSIDLGASRLLLVKIPHGTFRMGTDQVFTREDGWINDVERPVHQVTITRDFWIGQFPVTQREWQEVMGNNPSYFKDPDAPVEQVSFADVQAFLVRVNASQRQWIVRLPTEAEWEYAARAGTADETYGPLDEIAWYRSNGARTPRRVGQKRPNAFSLYDMLGNVWQWCQDWFGPYAATPAVDPQGSPTGDRRVTRGGCFYCDAVHERAARRNRDLVDHSSRSIGFRVVATPAKGNGAQ
jgi:formylglycine-generating enzyme required for sulfatase activity